LIAALIPFSIEFTYASICRIWGQDILSIQYFLFTNLYLNTNYNIGVFIMIVSVSDAKKWRPILCKKESQ